MKTRIGHAFAVTVLAAVVLAGCGSSDDAATTTTDDTTTTEATTTTQATTTTEATTTTTAAPAADQPDEAVWPFASTETRFDDPIAAASSFASDYLGFSDPVVGEFQQGDSRSGEVEIRPIATGPATVVFVRQVTDDDSWWVIGAGTDNIRIESPEALAAILSPVTISGQSTAFEATVNAELRQDDTIEPLVEGFVMGGSMGEMGPFTNSFGYPPPAADGGAIVLMTLSAEDGSIWEASVVRITFGG